MSETFTSIVIEAYLNSTWTDITVDVRHVPPPRVAGMGIMNNGLLDRTGDAGRFTFALDNSASNSGGILGWYTPNGTATRSGWRAGIPVRLSFTYDGYTRYKFYGFIDADGIDVEPFINRDRSVTVRASNWMRYASDHTLTLLQYQTNYRMDQAVQDIIDNSNRKPLKVEWHPGQITFPTMFDITKSETKATGEFDKLVRSEFGYIYIKGDETGGETLMVEDKDFRYTIVNNESSFGAVIPAKSSDNTDTLLMETGDHILTESSDRILLGATQRASYTASDIMDMQVTFGKNLFNHATFKIYPRTLDTSNVVLWQSNNPIKVLAAETLTDIRGQYNDPNNPDVKVNGYQMVIPAATTDYKMYSDSAGTGTDLTANLTVTAIYGTSEAQYSLANGGTVDGYVTLLQARGKGIYIYDVTEKVYDESVTSIPTFGVIPLVVDSPYLDKLDTLFTFASKTATSIFDTGGFLNGYSLNDMTIDSITFMVNDSSKLMLGFLFCEPPKLILLAEGITDQSGSGGYASYASAWFVNGYDFEIINMQLVKWTCCLKWVGRH